MKSKLTREQKATLFMLHSIDKLIKLGLIPKDLIKPEYRDIKFSKKVEKILKNFEPTEEEIRSVELFMDDDYNNMMIGGIS